MRKESESGMQFIYLRAEDVEERCRQRLTEGLGMDDESIEVVMNLRSQVIALQQRLRELESLLEVYQSGYTSRLIKYREVFYEAEWEEG